MKLKTPSCRLVRTCTIVSVSTSSKYSSLVHRDRSGSTRQVLEVLLVLFAASTRQVLEVLYPAFYLWISGEMEIEVEVLDKY